MSEAADTPGTDAPGDVTGSDEAADLRGLPPPPQVHQLAVGLMQNFCTLLWCPVTHVAALVDPAWEADRILRETEARGLTVRAVLVTHTHHDHIEGVAEIVRRTGARVVVDPREAARLGPLPDGTCVDAVDRGDVAVGQAGVRCLETTGHTVGGTCYLGDGFVVTGDVMFVRGCGRTDFPGGSTPALWRSLQRLAALPEETRVYPGHDYGPTPTSTIGTERLENPYLRCATFEQFRALRERPRR